MTKKSQTRMNRESLNRDSQTHTALLLDLERDHIAKNGKWKGVPSPEAYEDAMYAAAARTGADPIALARAIQWARSSAKQAKKERKIDGLHMANNGAGVRSGGLGRG